LNTARVKKADFAGAWYPDSKKRCIELFEEFKEDIGENKIEVAGKIRGAIVPHAGWIYSGRTAWSALSLASDSEVSLVVVFGEHLSSHQAPRIWDIDSCETPIRQMEYDREVFEKILSLDTFEIETATNYVRDNGIELVLPMIAHTFPAAKLIAIGMPASNRAIELGKKISEIIKDRKDVFFVGSTDLTHYGPSYGFTPNGLGEKSLEWVRRENDREFIECCVRTDLEEAIKSASIRHNACCPGAAVAAIAASNSQKGIMTSYATSHDRNGGAPMDFVGYAGIVLI